MRYSLPSLPSWRNSTAMAMAVLIVAASMPDFAWAAKRLGGGSSVGRQQSGITQRKAEPMQRNTNNAAPAQQAAPTGAAPGTPASPAAAPGAAAAPGGAAAPAGATGAAASPAAAQRPGASPSPAAPAAGNRWLGPLAGLAAGVGLSALFSHLGLGDELASFMSSFLIIALVAFAGIFLFRMLTRSRRQSADQGGDYAYAGSASASGSASAGNTSAPAGGWQRSEPAFNTEPVQRTASPFSGSAAPLGSELNVYGQPVASVGHGEGHSTASYAPSAPAGFGATQSADTPLIDLPEGFDTAGFLRAARGVFVKLQAANDAGDVNTLREFVSDELLGIFQDEIARRGGVAQSVEVVSLESELVAYERDWDEHIASVVFTGSVREEAGGPTERIEEVWNLSRPVRQSGGWTLVGIQSL